MLQLERQSERIAKILEHCIATVRDDYRQGRKRNCTLLAILPSQVRQCAKSCTVDVPIGRADRHDAFPAIRRATRMAAAGWPQNLTHRSLRGAGERRYSLPSDYLTKRV